MSEDNITEASAPESLGGAPVSPNPQKAAPAKPCGPSDNRVCIDRCGGFEPYNPDDKDAPKCPTYCKHFDVRMSRCMEACSVG